MIKLSITDYVSKVLLKIIIVSTIAGILPVIILQAMPESIFRLFVITIITLTVTSVIAYLLGLTKNEKIFINDSLKKLKQHVVGLYR